MTAHSDTISGSGSVSSASTIISPGCAREDRPARQDLPSREAARDKPMNGQALLLRLSLAQGTVLKQLRSLHHMAVSQNKVPLPGARMCPAYADVGNGIELHVGTISALSPPPLCR